MASTRNKNTPGDYNARQKSFIAQVEYITNKESAISNNTMYAGNGLLQGRLPDTELSTNPNDIESFLFGIGSTNLVVQLPPVQPELKQLSELSIVDRRVPLIMPENLMIHKGQRPYFLGN